MWVSEDDQDRLQAEQGSTYFVPSFSGTVNILDSFWLCERDHIRAHSNNVTMLLVNINHWRFIFAGIRVKHSPHVGKGSEEGTVIFGEAIFITKEE